MGFERNYQVLSLSKQRHTSRGNSSLQTHHCSLDNFKLVPNWVTGFVDGEGCFTVSITQRKDIKLGWHVKPSFTIGLHKKDKPLLQKNPKFFRSRENMSTRISWNSPASPIN